MILEETMNKYLRDSVNEILNIPDFAIRSKQINAQRKEGNYCDVDLVSITGLGEEQRTYTNIDGDDENVTENLQGLRRVMYSITFYRQGAHDYARYAKLGFKRSSIYNAASLLNIGLLSVSDVRNIDEVVDNDFEQRAQIDVFLSIVATDADVLAVINSLTIDGEYQNQSEIHTFEISNS